MKSSKPDSPNLDLINMVQRARMMNDADAQPSAFGAVYWIEAKLAGENAPTPTQHAGEWRIFTTVRAVDDLWAIIKMATLAGKLGYKAKVSTQAGPGQTSPDARLICVRTVDAGHQADVARVKMALVALGIHEPMTYHPD